MVTSRHSRAGSTGHEASRASIEVTRRSRLPRLLALYLAANAAALAVAVALGGPLGADAASEAAGTVLRWCRIG